MASWSASFWPGVPTEKAIAKPDCFLLSAGRFRLRVVAWNRNYFILLFVGVFLSSFGSTANPQMFALAREHADRTGREAVMFSSILRAQVSLAWVIGPRSPTHWQWFGFTVMYLSAAVAFVVCGAMVWFFLPSMRKEPKVATGTLEAPRRNRRDALLLFIICTLMWERTASISLICRCFY